MTAAEAATFFASLPPETLVLVRAGPTLDYYQPVRFGDLDVYRTTTGVYSRFLHERHQHRNDIRAVVVR